MATKFLLFSYFFNPLPEDSLSPIGQKKYPIFATGLHMVLIRISLRYSLEAALANLETLLTRSNRRAWVSACFALCLIFRGAEILQQGIHQEHPPSTASSICEAMKLSSILPLAQLFSASTAGFHPLDLDWEVEENAALVDNDHQTIDSLRSLQALSQEYSTYRENL